MAVGHHVEFLKNLYADEVGRIEAHHQARVSRNWSIHSRDIAIFRFSKWPPLQAWIFEIAKVYWLMGSRGSSRISVPNIVKICQSVVKIYNFEFSKWRPPPFQIFKFVKFHWQTVSGGPRLIIVLNFVKIGRSVAEIFRFFKFSRRPPPPSWIFEIAKFYWLTESRESRLFKISQSVAKIFQDGGRMPSWICLGHIWTTHSEYLWVSITLQNLVVIDALVFII